MSNGFKPRAGALRYRNATNVWVWANPGDAMFSTVTMSATEYWKLNHGWASIHKPEEQYRVVVHGVGDIGCVSGADESEARCAAQLKYGAPGTREGGDADNPCVIYEDDDFDVRAT